MSERSFKIVTALLAITALTPLMLVHSEMWDMTLAEMAWKRGDFTLIHDWLMDFGYHYKYYTYIITDSLNHLTGIPHKFFTNILSVVSVLGIAREVFLWLMRDYGFNRKTAYIGAWTVIAFPVWHTLISSAVFINILCLWVFMIGVRVWKTNKFIALILILPSFQLFSLFAFSVGFLVSNFALTANKENYRAKAVKVFLGSCLLVIAFAVFTSVVNLHGPAGKGYNSFSLERLDSFWNFGLLSIAVLLLTWGITKTIKEKREAERFSRHMLSFLILAFFSAMAYWAVGRPLRFFAFGSFTARHTYLTCIPFALLIAIAANYLSTQIRRSWAKGLATLLVVTLVVLLHQGYSHKAAAIIFKEMLTQQFAMKQEPPSGYVGIVVEGAKPPRHVHDYAINMCLYNAYGKAAWMANGFWKRGLKISRSTLEKNYDVPPLKRKRKLCLDVTGDSYTEYVFKLSNYHQEGRFWYWFYYLTNNYSAFHPQLTLRVKDQK